MDINDIHILIGGIDHNVDMSFFENVNISQEELIGDTYFLKSKDSNGQPNCLISVHKNYYDIIKRDLRIRKIFE